MRVSQQMLFSRYVNNMNTSLTDLLDLNVKAQTMKKVSKPSDNPTGMTRILDHRDTLRSIEQYKENISTAEGWLSRSDGTMQQVSTLLTRAKELATQAATGTVSGDNREQVSYELRSIYDQLLGLANTTFEGKSIYAGQKTDGKAFEKIMWMTTNDPVLNSSSNFRIDGSSEDTVLVQFTDPSGTAQPGDRINLSTAGVRWSNDGGKSWQSGTVTNNGDSISLDLGASGTSVTFSGDPQVRVTPDGDVSDASGTWLWLRPSARYVGDDENAIDVSKVGDGVADVNANAAGSFNGSNVVVRIDNTSQVKMDGDILYSYSFDGGQTWKTNNRAPADNSSNSATLSIAPGGTLTLTSNGSNYLQPGTQFMIRPRTADIELNISATEKVRINDVGMDIFGGVYMDPSAQLNAGASYTVGLTSSNGAPLFSDSSMAGTVLLSNAATTPNLFETLGNLIAFAETNNQTGVQQALANLEKVHEHVMNHAADVGGRENRLTTGKGILSGLELNEKAMLSSIEDADVSELLTQLNQKEIIYRTVLQSTSMIMNLNLSKFI